MKYVYICSPLKGSNASSFKENLQRAKQLSQWAYRQGNGKIMPICPHIYLQEATGLDELQDPSTRAELLRLGLALIDKCDEVWVFPGGGDYLSSGMMSGHNDNVTPWTQ